MENLTTLNPFTAYAEIPPYADVLEPITTFWGDFRVCGTSESDIRDTFKRAFNAWKDDIDYGTELSIALNYLMWYYHGRDDDKTSRIYEELWRKIDGYIVETWKGDELSYYLRTTD